MNMPVCMPLALRRTDLPIFARASPGGLTSQDFLDPRNIACAAACSRKSGFAACLARCLVTGEACDGGIDNCDRV
jgi:hypothetical protein